MFNKANFIMKTLHGMIGNYPDFQVREYALNWHKECELTEEHLAEIELAIENQHIKSSLETDYSIDEENNIETENDDIIEPFPDTTELIIE